MAVPSPEVGSPALTLPIAFGTPPDSVLGRLIRQKNPGSLTAVVEMVAHPDTLLALPRERPPVAAIYPPRPAKLDQGRRAELINAFTYDGFNAKLSARNPITVRVDADGLPIIVDGVLRVSAAAAAGLTAIPVRIVYLGGSEYRCDAWQPRLTPRRGPPGDPGAPGARVRVLAIIALLGAARAPRVVVPGLVAL